MYKELCPKCGKPLVKKGINNNGFTVFKKCNHIYSKEDVKKAMYIFK